MEYHSYAAYAVFLRLSAGLRRTRKLFMVEYEKASKTQSYHSPSNCAPNWPIPVTVGMLGILHKARLQK